MSASFPQIDSWNRDELKTMLQTDFIVLLALYVCHSPVPKMQDPSTQYDYTYLMYKYVTMESFSFYR